MRPNGESCAITDCYYAPWAEALTNYLNDLLNRANAKRQVTIEVYGGVAECTKRPEDIEVSIIGHDNEEG